MQIVYDFTASFSKECVQSSFKTDTVEHICCCRSICCIQCYACFFLTILTYILCLLSDVTSYPDSVASHSQSGYPNRKVHVFLFFQILMKCRELIPSLQFERLAISMLPEAGLSEQQLRPCMKIKEQLLTIQVTHMHYISLQSVCIILLRR